MNILNRVQPEAGLRRNIDNSLHLNVLRRPTNEIPRRNNNFEKPELKKQDSIVDFKKVIAENTDEFCQNSTLHGLKYIVDEQLYPGERIFFAMSFVAVVLMSIFFISNVYAKWRSTPVIVGINPEPSFIVNEPFPAVTLCNLNQASKARAKVYKEDSSEYTMLQLLCKREVNLSMADSINWNNFEDFIVNISQPCEEMIVGCNYGAIDYKCSDIFRTIVTDEGLCCVFNMLSPNFMYNVEVSKLRNQTYNDEAAAVNWDPERGYPDELPEVFYPRTSVGTGITLGLSLTFDIDLSDYYCSSTASVGLKMALHSPAEIPHVREIGTLLPAGSETKIRIRTDKTEAALNLKSIDKQYRKCLFDGEEKLEYFSYYNRRNCERECQARQLLDSCKCLNYYMPMLEKDARICGLKDTPCVEMVLQNKRNRSHTAMEDCQHKCWPSCFDLNFYTDFFSAPISHEGFAIANKFVKNTTSEYAEKNMAVVHFYFTDNTFRSTKQTEFIGMTDFLSSVGGLMGLFMGFSFISIAEFIYYAVLRPYHVVKRHDRIKGGSRMDISFPDSRNPSLRFIDAPSYYVTTDPLIKPSKLQQFPQRQIERRNSEHFGHIIQKSNRRHNN
ncbi:pickpocket protein 28-like [Lucilia cuprina]|uniref:pickpocket protein 28-like n=1 Tax=Lucilia cuprina TaxID=7375 RepID=UPI001F062567|nr:pickpocket protein 28-like [Lucilia cuprina]